MNRTASLLLAALTLFTSLAACGPKDDRREVGAEEQGLSAQAIALGKNVSVDPKLSHWPSKLENIQVRPANTESASISYVSPSVAQRGQLISINGTNFSKMTFLGQRFLVDFQAGSSRVSVSPWSISNTVIQVVVPGTATTGTVRLINAANGVMWTESILPLTINLPMPTTGVVRFTNNSQFEVLSLVVNGREQLFGGNVIVPGGFLDVTGPGGLVPFAVDLGFGATFFHVTDSVTIVNGLTNNASISRITAVIALTYGAHSATFDGVYYDNNQTPHAASIVFTSAGGWQLFSDSALVTSGTVADGAFAPGASAIAFSVRNINGSLSGSIDFPYAAFDLRNGPPSWPAIHYVRR